MKLTAALNGYKQETAAFVVVKGKYILLQKWKSLYTIQLFG